MTIRTLALAVVGLVLLVAPDPARAALRVVTTVPDLAELARTVGGPEVEVEHLVKGPQDPHFVQARPSYVRLLHDADLFVLMGLDLEAGWAPVILRSARNPDLLPGSAGYLDASTAIEPLEVPGMTVDRSAGDVHPFGNPHYLSDPLNGIRVARLLRNRLARLDPVHEDGYRQRAEAFTRQALRALVGEEALARFDTPTLISAIEGGRVEALLGEAPGGWLGDMAPYEGTKVVQDHRVFNYFTNRFGLRPVTELEPKPGIAPTTRHVAKVVEMVRDADIPLILASPYFDPRHARRVAEQTGAAVVPLAHQVGAIEGADSYLGTVDLNVGRVVEALSP